MFKSILTTAADGSNEPVGLLLCFLTALILGLVISYVYMMTTTASKNFVITLMLLPAMVQAVIILVNGNLGTSVAVLGAFSLIRFRSVPGSSKEISTIFLAMAIGLATGMGCVAYAVLVTIVICGVIIVLSKTSFGETKSTEKELKVVIPENLDYNEIFDDLFEQFTKKVSLDRVKTTNMGSMYELCYRIVLKDEKQEKELIDQVRCRNGNLTIVCGRPTVNRDEL